MTEPVDDTAIHDVDKAVVKKHRDAEKTDQLRNMEVDKRTACAGILTQKVFPGAIVLATGRTTNLINESILEGNAFLYDLEPFSEADRDVMVEKMEDNIGERTRIQQELQRISTKNNEVYFKTPLMLKNIIQLVIEKKVDVKQLKNASEIYLMFSMKNLDFHTDQNTSFTELDPAEHQDFLKLSMMICQDQIQNSEGIGNFVVPFPFVRSAKSCQVF